MVGITLGYSLGILIDDSQSSSNKTWHIVTSFNQTDPISFQIQGESWRISWIMDPHGVALAGPQHIDIVDDNNDVIIGQIVELEAAYLRKGMYYVPPQVGKGTFHIDTSGISPVSPYDIPSRDETSSKCSFPFIPDSTGFLIHPPTAGLVYTIEELR